MEILSVNAESVLAGLASSIGRDQTTWKDWVCLHITFEGSETEECLAWTKSVIESYLQNIEGRIFFCHDTDVYIVCKETSLEILEHAGNLISDLALNERETSATYKLYDLGEQGYAFASDFFELANLLEADAGPGEGILDHLHEFALFSIAEKYTEKEMRPLDAPKVLLVEDDPVTRWMVRNAVKQTCHLATAPEANKAYDLYSSYQPDVVFLDIDLPDASGYDVLQWIMVNDPGADVVMFSSNGDMDNIVKAMERGAKGFIAKPFLKEQLLHYVQGH